MNGLMCGLRKLNRRRSAPKAVDGSAPISSSKPKSEGLHVLLDAPSDKRSLDIVLIHGMHAHWLGSYTDRDTGVCWVRDLLPLDMEGISFRVLSYGYDTAADDPEPMENVVRDFLLKLNDLRRKTQTEALPILYIAHSLGGILLKSALMLSSEGLDIISSVPAAALFFGVPANYARDYERVCGEANPQAESPNMQALRRDLMFLGSNNVRFEEAGLPSRYHCQYFLESTGLEDVRGLEEGELARLPLQEKVKLSKGHGPMIRYANRDEPDYQRIVACMKSAIERLLVEHEMPPASR